MKNHNSEMLDLALTQAIECYVEMDADEVHAAITRDWPEQIAVLLEEALFKSTCGTCSGMADFIEVERDNDHGHYMAPLCSCDMKLPFDGGF